MENQRKKKVIVAMSGGVDSSVAAATLLEQGYDCAGVFVRMLPPNLNIDKNLKGHIKDAQTVCEQLGIELYIVDYSWDMQQIIDYFTYEYSIRNHKSETAEVRFEHRIWGIWEMVSSSHEYRIKGSDSVEFSVGIPPDSEENVIFEYRIDNRHEILLRGGR